MGRRGEGRGEGRKGEKEGEEGREKEEEEGKGEEEGGEKKGKDSGEKDRLVADDSGKGGAGITDIRGVGAAAALHLEKGHGLCRQCVLRILLRARLGRKSTRFTLSEAAIGGLFAKCRHAVHPQY